MNAILERSNPGIIALKGEGFEGEPTIGVWNLTYIYIIYFAILIENIDV